MGGGDGGGIYIERVKFELQKTKFLKQIYNKLDIQGQDEINTYVGKVKRK